MAGTITETALIQEGAFFFPKLADGRRFAIWIYESPIEPGCLYGVYYVQWKWDTAWTVTYAEVLTDSNEGIVQDIETNGGYWDASWSCLTPREVNQRFTDWSKGVTTRHAEASTVGWWAVKMAGLQQDLDAIVHNAVDPGPPPAPPPRWAEFPPLLVGDMGAASALYRAQGTRLIGQIDPANPNRPVLGCIAIP